MPHIDDETLALHTLGEIMLRPERDHLHTCPDCAGTVRRLKRVVDALNVPASTARLGVSFAASSVWLRVRGELNLDPAGDSEPGHVADAALTHRVATDTGACRENNGCCVVWPACSSRAS